MGCGVVASYGHLPAIRAADVELVAVYDPIKAAAEAMATRFETKAFTDQEAFFDSGLDAVVICSPAPVHRDNVFAAAERGLHILCEKPLGMDDEEVESMIKVCERAKVGFGVGFVYRFAPISRQIKTWVEDGSIGDLKVMRLSYIWELHGQFDQDEKGKWRQNPRWVGRMLEGGPMVDCGVHQIDLARWWSGKEVLRSHGVGAWVTEGYEAPDHMWLHMDHEDGVHTMAEVSFSYGHTAHDPAPLFTYDLIGTGGTIRYDRNGWRFERRNGEGTLIAPGSSEKDFYGMHAAFARALRTGDWSEMPDPRDGLIATQIAREATEAVIATRPIKRPTFGSKAAK